MEPSTVSENNGVYAALMLPEILENIFKFCKFDDLISCMLVCKKWMNVANKLWSPGAYVQIQEIGSKNDKRISEYLQLAREKVSNNFVNFNIKLCYSRFHLNTLISLFKLHGHKIIILKLEVNQFPNENPIREILFKYCPNMKSLSLYGEMLSFPNGYVKNLDAQENKNVRRIEISPLSLFYAKISWMELLSNFPNLKGLKLIGFVTGEHIQEIFAVINTIRKQDPIRLNLKEIHTLASKRVISTMIERIPPSLLEFLQSPSVKIESLALTLSCVDDITITKSVITTHASSLKSLELGTSDGHFMDYFDYGLSIKLQMQLQLFQTMGTLKLSQNLLKLLTVLKFMPNVRKLVIHKGHDTYLSRCPKISEITCEYDLERFSHGGLSDLELYMKENAQGIIKLIRWFPNVEKLKIPLTNETFEIICQGWPNLTTLNINGSKVDECGITGLDGGQVIRINNAKGNHCKRPDTVPRANITALKQLKSFHMSADCSCCRSPYSFLRFCSVVHGFRLSACPENIFVKNYKVNEELWSPESEFFYRTLV